MRTAYAFLDIETVPARWREFPHALTVPPAHALLGAANAIKGPPANYSKPETIAKWWQEQTDKTPARAVKWYRGGALDPKRGEVLCIGWGLGTGDPIVLWEATERETLIALQGQLAVWAPEHIVAHGGNHFDFGFLWERATHHRLHELARWFLRVPFRHRVRLGLGDARTVLVDTAELTNKDRVARPQVAGNDLGDAHLPVRDWEGRRAIVRRYRLVRVIRCGRRVWHVRHEVDRLLVIEADDLGAEMPIGSGDKRLQGL